MKAILLLVISFMSITAFAADVTIYAAASTTNAVNSIISEFEKKTGYTAVASFASSGTLAKQISNGAPADIFISANPKWMKWVEEKGMVEKSELLLANRLALVVNVKSEQKIAKADTETVSSLFNGKKFSIADPEHAPAGRYAQKAMETLGLWDSLKGNAARMQTVRAALALVERNAVPYGIVYSSDASASKLVKVLALFDESLHGAIRYPVAVVKDKNSDAVKAMYSFLFSDESYKIFSEYGFMKAE
jgi:molybdate transport system substrate-binding protein